ncbi:MAG: HEPN domain-containing protein [Actinobacteria bacterium]|nr:HEPN domain-containing protein [Actinomycetota bacterium]
MSATDVRAYAAKAEEYLEAAEDALRRGRYNAATSSAIHAGINAADAITGALRGVRSSDSDHNRAVDLLEATGKDGKDASKHLARLIPLKTKAEYDPGTVPRSKAESAVKSASRIVEISRRLLT